MPRLERGVEEEARMFERTDPDFGRAPSSGEREDPGGLIERLRRRGPKGSRYRVLDEVARGGMGVIWKVRDDDLRRTLAMKVRLARTDAPDGAERELDAKSLGRFLEEAQITGQLDHPGIVPVHELGLADDGRVYFTMRLVQGDDLERVFELVARREEGWSETRALGVLLKACEAVSYAHAKGVLHRDLKPANVMVGKYGEVYVMDWGLAGVLGAPDRHDLRVRPASDPAEAVRTERREAREDAPDSTFATMDGDVVGTPAYMPPEQARGQLDRMGPQSDVYSLGAMLYQLLAGERPYVAGDAALSQHEVLLRVIDAPPRPLRETARRAPAELIAICERAMARDPAQRYRDVQELADDLRAYLEGRVVRAHATGTWAETKKWVQRNRAFAGSLAAAVLAVAVGAVGFALQARRANHNAAVAEASATSAQAARSAAEASAALARDREREARASEARAERVTELVKRALSDSDPNLGGSQQILVVDAMQSAIRELESDALRDDPRTEAALRATIASILDGNGRSEEALRLAEQALATRRQLFPGDDLEVESSLQVVADALESLGRSAESLPLREEALAMARRLFPGDHAEVSTCSNNLGACLAELGRADEALERYEEGLAMYRRLVPGDDPDLASSIGNVAACLESVGRAEEALALHEEALEMRRRLFRGDHAALAASLNNVASCMQRLGRDAEALPEFEAALAMMQRLFRGDHPRVATSLNNLGACLDALGRDEEALAQYRAALDMHRRLFEGDHPLVASGLNNVGVCLGTLGRGDESLVSLEAALRMYERLYSGDHPDVARTLENLATCLDSIGEHDEALPNHELALEMRERLHAGDHPEVALSLCNLAACLEALDRDAEALTYAERGRAMAERSFPEGHPWRRAAAATCARIRAKLAK